MSRLSAPLDARMVSFFGLHPIYTGSQASMPSFPSPPAAKSDCIMVTAVAFRYYFPESLGLNMLAHTALKHCTLLDE